MAEPERPDSNEAPEQPAPGDFATLSRFVRGSPGPIETVVFAATEPELDRLLPGWLVPRIAGTRTAVVRNPATGGRTMEEVPVLARPDTSECTRAPDWSGAPHVRWYDHRRDELADLIAALAWLDTCEVAPRLDEPARVGPEEWPDVIVAAMPPGLADMLAALDAEAGLARLRHYSYRDPILDRARVLALTGLARTAHGSGRRLYTWIDASGA